MLPFHARCSSCSRASPSPGGKVGETQQRRDATTSSRGGVDCHDSPPDTLGASASPVGEVDHTAPHLRSSQIWSALMPSHFSSTSAVCSPKSGAGASETVEPLKRTGQAGIL